MLFFYIIETWINWSLTSGSKDLEYLFIVCFCTPSNKNWNWQIDPEVPDALLKAMLRTPWDSDVLQQIICD